jgi:DNA-binding MarR family transcriptional regulator
MNYAQIPDDILPKVRTWSAMQLAIWADVHTMCKAGMAYYRTNEQLAERFGADDRTVRRVVSQLIACGAITAEQDGKRRILQSVTDFAERKRTKRSPDQSVPGPTGPRTNQSEKEDQLVRDGGPTGPEMGDQSVLQVESIVESRVEQLVEKGPKPKKAKRERVFHDVVMPYDTDTFRAAWREWLDYKWAQHQFAYKRAQDEQTALHHLQKNSNGNEQLAIHIIATSIANGWRGLFESAAKSFMGPGSRTGRHLRPSGEYAHPSDVLKDRNIWG